MFKMTRRFGLFLTKLTNGRIVFALIFMLLAGLTEGLSLIILVPLLAALDPTNSAGGPKIPWIGDGIDALSLSLASLLVFFVFLIAMQAFLVRLKSLYVARVMHRAIDALRIEVFSSVGAARWEIAGKLRPSDISHVMIGEVDRVRSATSSLLAVIQSIVMLSVYVALAAIVSWQMALFATLVGGTLFAVLYPVRRRATRYGQELSLLFQRQSATVLEFLSGVRIAKSFVVEEEYGQRLADHLRTVRAKTIAFASISTSGTMLFQIASAVFAALFVWLAVNEFSLTLPEIAVLLLIFVRLAPRFSNLQDSLQAYLAALPAYENVESQIDFYRSHAEQRPIPGIKAPRFDQVIRFNGVILHFEGSTQPVLDGVDLTLEHGRTTALIGSSGSGKSTIADLTMGLLRPTGGTITIDGVPLDDGNRRLWRKEVAFVPQEPFLLNDTIRANLLIGRAEASDSEIARALDLANAKFVYELAQGIETQVGERGSRFSGGERQRIALARALLREPDLLILDEATSALDWVSQQAIAKAIASLPKDLTILTIAHRPSMIDLADNVIAIEAGKVIEQGSFKELAARPESRLAQLLRNENTAESRTGMGQEAS